MRLSRIAAGGGLASLLALATGCGGSSDASANKGTGSSGAPVTAAGLLQEAKTSIDAAQSVHFVISSTGVGTDGTNITGGQGDLARPDDLQGSFTVTVDGFDASVKVVAKGSVFEAELPFTSHYARANPASFGFSNPALLLSPTNGLSTLLIDGTGAHLSGQERVDGELLDRVTTTVPGRAIPVLPDANPSQPVALTAAIDPSSHQLRQVNLVGPFTAKSPSTFTVTLTDYGEQVTVTLPAT
jgi:lipoprotein LprG